MGEGAEGGGSQTGAAGANGAGAPGAAFTIASLLAPRPPRPPRPPLAPPALRLHHLAAAASGFHAAHDFFGEFVTILFLFFCVMSNFIFRRNVILVDSRMNVWKIFVFLF